MENRNVLIVVLILLIVIVTGFFIWKSLDKKIYHSPEELLPPLKTIPLDKKYCYDTDKGLNYFQKGLVIWGLGDGELHYSYDYCTSDPTWGDGTLFEMYCVGDSFKIKDMNCAIGSCQQGACIE